MTYTRVRINKYYGRSLDLKLNEVTDGWVPQILNGTFGSNREYNFAGNVVTSMSEKQIDINMRLTPVVPIPAKPASYFLNLLSDSTIGDVTLTNDNFKVPFIDYKSGETTTYTKPVTGFFSPNTLEQSCVIRELKYNYSESPATIEFTISTKKPILYGPKFTIYMGLGNQNWDQAVADVQRVINDVNINIGEVDFRTVELSLPAIGDSTYNVLSVSNISNAFRAILKGDSTNNPGKFSMYSLINGTKSFSITGGYDINAASCYALKAYPSFPLNDVAYWVSFLKPAPKIKLGDKGNGYAKIEMVVTRKGL